MKSSVPSLPFLVLGLLLLLFFVTVDAFRTTASSTISSTMIPSATTGSTAHCGISPPLFATSGNTEKNDDNNDNNDDDDEVYYEVPKTITRSEADYMDDLTPPPVNFARNSILFSDNPATKKNNSALSVWLFTRTYLPAVVSGAWPWKDLPRLDDRPIESLYNTVFVRLPLCAVAGTYVYHKLVDQQDLVMDFGFDPFAGPQPINPIIVVGVLFLILL